MKLILCMLLTACTVRVFDTNRLINDYKTEGFLDFHHFQVIITDIPDKKKRGLVERRDSALENAKSRMHEVILEKLIEYCLNNQCAKANVRIDDILNLTEVKGKLKEELNSYLKYGYIAFNYYNEDNSVVIVYRIYKDDLYYDIESVEVELKTAL